MTNAQLVEAFQEGFEAYVKEGSALTFAGKRHDAIGRDQGAEEGAPRLTFIVFDIMAELRAAMQAR